MGNHYTFLDGNKLIEEAIAQYYTDSSKENLLAVLNAVRQRMHEDGQFIFPVIMDEDDTDRSVFRTIQAKDGKLWNAAFTSRDEYEKGDQTAAISLLIDRTMQFCLKYDTEGFIINPWGQSFMLTKDMIEMICKTDGGSRILCS